MLGCACALYRIWYNHKVHALVGHQIRGNTVNRRRECTNQCVKPLTLQYSNTFKGGNANISLAICENILDY